MTAPVALASQPGPGHDVDSRRGAAALAGGVFSLMTDAQREGRACPWCNVEVDLETGVDLGERELHRAMVVFHPVGCRTCVSREARDAHFTHHRTCTRCFYWIAARPSWRSAASPFVTPRKRHDVVLVPEVWHVWLRKKSCAR
ncbi:hypothetical protein GCM10010385_54280 [Streptomyces geysiriensis]|nr:hypothetical protein AUW26_31135 [Streptomyces sp. CC71]GGY97608.1 hypothetical protein GCM10010385_54280 [Streptomyces geysiriensis]